MPSMPPSSPSDRQQPPQRFHFTDRMISRSWAYVAAAMILGVIPCGDRRLMWFLAAAIGACLGAACGVFVKRPLLWAALGAVAMTIAYSQFMLHCGGFD